MLAVQVQHKYEYTEVFIFLSDPFASHDIQKIISTSPTSSTYLFLLNLLLPNLLSMRILLRPKSKPSSLILLPGHIIQILANLILNSVITGQRLITLHLFTLLLLLLFPQMSHQLTVDVTSSGESR